MMPSQTDLPRFISQCRAVNWEACAPRRLLDTHAWQEDWQDTLATLETFVEEGCYGQSLEGMDEYELEDACIQWEHAAHLASTLLRQMVDRGLPPDDLSSFYRDVLSVWHDLALALKRACHAGMLPSPQVLRPDTQDYPYALQLLALGVLLDAQDEIPGIVEHLLLFQTDRLLDYLSAAATGIQEASEATFHPNPFGGLTPFFEQYGQVSPEPLAPYLEQHYSQYFALPPRQQKKQGRLTGPQAWGWWALEVAALVVLYELNDGQLRHNPHYPTDLADFAARRYRS